MTQLLLLVLVATVWDAQSGTPGARTDLLNICMDAKHHKTKPGPKDKLHDQVRMEVGSRVAERADPKNRRSWEMGRSALQRNGVKRVAEAIPRRPPTTG